MTYDCPNLRRRGDGPRLVHMTVAVKPETREAIRRIAAADGVADGALARAAIESGLPLQADLRRNRRNRRKAAAEREAG